MMMIYPFPHIIISFFINKVIESFHEGYLNRLVTSASYAAVIIVVISNLYIDYKFIYAFRLDKTSTFWSKEIFNLIEYIKENKEKPMFLWIGVP